MKIVKGHLYWFWNNLHPSKEQVLLIRCTIDGGKTENTLTGTILTGNSYSHAETYMIIKSEHVIEFRNIFQDSNWNFSMTHYLIRDLFRRAKES